MERATTDDHQRENEFLVFRLTNTFSIRVIDRCVGRDRKYARVSFGDVRTFNRCDLACGRARGKLIIPR